MTDRLALKDEYFRAASDHYAAGRFAFWTNSLAVCGKLLHHATEMFCKGHLLLTMTLEEVTDLEHSLPRMWRVFKEAIRDPRLAAFDRTIENVHAFEAIRYPDLITETGGVFHLALTRADVDRDRAADMGLGQSPKYLLALQEVDRLILLLFDVCDCNPAIFLHGRFRNRDRIRFLKLKNPVWKKV